LAAEDPKPTNRASSGYVPADPFSQAAAMVAVPFLFGLLGAFLDSVIGTRPVLLVTLALLGAVCAFISAYYHYGARVQSHYDDRVFIRRARP
jgi:F0F1-type ATP synthase assembly protein I